MVSLGGVLDLQGVVDLLVTRLGSGGDPQIMDLVLIVCKDDAGAYMGGKYDYVGISSPFQ